MLHNVMPQAENGGWKYWRVAAQQYFKEYLWGCTWATSRLDFEKKNHGCHMCPRRKLWCSIWSQLHSTLRVVASDDRYHASYNKICWEHNGSCCAKKNTWLVSDKFDDVSIQKRSYPLPKSLANKSNLNREEVQSNAEIIGKLQKASIHSDEMHGIE